MSHDRNTTLLRTSSAFLISCVAFVLLFVGFTDEVWSRSLKIEQFNTSNEIQPGDLWVKVNNKGLMGISSGLKFTGGNIIKGSLDVNFNTNCLTDSLNSYGFSDNHGNPSHSGNHRVTLVGPPSNPSKQWFTSCSVTNDFHFQDIPLASMADLQRQCDINDGTTSIYNIELVITVGGESKPVSIRTVPAIEVQCSDDYVAFKRRARFRVSEFQYVCAEGYVIQGTQEWLVTSPHSTDPLCVRPEDSSSYPVIHDRPKPVPDGSSGKG